MECVIGSPRAIDRYQWNDHRLKRWHRRGGAGDARNLATNMVRTATSSTTGAYSMTNLDVGTYEVMDDFKTFLLSSLELTGAQVSNVNAVLMPAATNEQVTVSAETVAPIDLGAFLVREGADMS